MGSSPQVRGPHWRRSRCHHLRRLIPAGAGTTWVSLCYCGHQRAHPRRCGDHLDDGHTLVSHQGSSPQVRGPPGLACATAVINGLIPAGAGTTSMMGIPLSATRAHPRRCGDHLESHLVAGAVPGSSPQVRGPLGADSSEADRKRLIPAGAGTTSSAAFASIAAWAHPRRCGDHVK